MMILSEQFSIKLRDMVRQNPLLAREIRRVEGLGELYIASPDAEVDETFDELYRLKIDNMTVVVYARHPDWSEEK